MFLPSKYARVFILVVEIMQYSLICKHDFKSVLFVHKGRVFTGDFSGRSANDNRMAKTVDLPKSLQVKRVSAHSKARPQHWDLRGVLFSNSAWVLLRLAEL